MNNLRKINFIFLLVLMLIISGFLVGCGGEAKPTVSDNVKQVEKAPSEGSAESKEPEESSGDTAKQPTASADKKEPAEQTTPSAPTPNTPVSGSLKAHFIDVGQADSILIQSPSGAAVLVDGGNNSDGAAIVSYLKAQGVKELAAVIGTHPHEDHIGGLDTVINSFRTHSVYIPNATSTTKTFEDFIAAINKSGAKRIQAKAGVNLNVDGLSGTFLAPNNSNYNDTNNYSAVLKITHGGISFLFTGDAEGVSESEMLSNGQNLKATVLKVGHHGSDSSTTSAFLKAVTPKFAIISVGKDNSYGHPSSDTLTKLSGAGVQVYRTDQSGTIIATSDGETIKFNLQSPANPQTAKPTPAPAPTPTPKPAPEPKPDPAPSNPVAADVTVYITKTGTKYHLDGCNSLSKSKIPITLTEAKSKNYGPCSRCKPPN